MKPERWQQIEPLYHAALERESEERAAFLDEACAGDAELRREVESLLAYEERAAHFITSPPDEVAAEMLAAEQPRSPLGKSFGHYRILSLLGKGGMGEVYQARDTRLNRAVALKVLPADFAQNKDRLLRFEQEARATSALNHPNILTVHDFGLHDGNPFLVMELLEGDPLREPMKQGALPVRKAIDYAQQIANGLAAAHEKGVVHRDLKPENLFVTTDGRVKILDFGLAKLRPPRNEPIGSEVATQKQITNPGTVMGTVAYMSPEQVRGEVVDHRSDLFSFGLILYEMLSGQRAFQRETMAETMAAILKEEAPELNQINLNPALDKIVRRCLEKRPERRFQTASDLGFALEALATPSGARLETAALPTVTENLTSTSKAKLFGNARLAWMVAGVLALVAMLALGVAYFKRSAADPRAVRLSFTPPENLAFDNGLNDSVVVSPDGQKLVFTGRSADGKRQLWVRPLNSSEAQPLPGTDDPGRPFWSPDSRSIGFGSQGKLKRIDLAGGRPQTLCDVISYSGGAWSKAGVILFSKTEDGGLFQIPATGGEPQPVTSPDPARRGHRYPYFLPDGRHFLYRVAREQRVFAGSLDSKEVKQVLADAAPAVYAPPGWLLFVRNGALLAQSFDAEHLELKGDAFPLTQPNNNANVFGVPFSVSENGVLIWQGDREHEYQLVWFDREGKQNGTVGPPIKVTLEQAPRLSPDGKRVAIHRIDPQTRNCDIWVIDLMRNLPTRLTSDPLVDQMPIWSPDGNHLVFNANRGGVKSLYQKVVSGVGAEELLLQGGSEPTDWSTDRRFIIFSLRTEKNRRDVWALPLTGSQQPSPLLNSDFDEYRAQLSPDGHWLAYVSDESGSYEVYVQPFTAEGKLGGDKKRISTNGGNHPRFRRDGRELFYVAADGQMVAVAIKTSGTTLEFETPKALFKTRIQRGQAHSWIEYDVTADGQRFLIGTMVGEPTPVSVILNWTAEMKR